MLNKKEYELLNDLERDEDLLDDFLEIGSYNTSSYICDLISEIADSHISIYNSDLWENAPKIEDCIEEVIKNYLCPTDTVDLMKIFQGAEFVYNDRVMYANLENLIFNYGVNYIEEKRKDSNKYEVAILDEIDNDELEAIISNIDSGDRLSAISDAIDEYLEEKLAEDDEESPLEELEKLAD